MDLFMILDWTYHHQIPLCKFIFSNDIFYGVVPGFAIDCPCGVWCHGLTTFLLHCVHFLEIWSVSLTLRKTFFIAFIFLYIYIIYLNISYVINTYFYLPYFSISNSALFFSKYLCTLFFYRRSPDSFHRKICWSRISWKQFPDIVLS